MSAIAVIFVSVLLGASPNLGEALVGPARFAPMYPAPNEPEAVDIPAFHLDTRPVTNEEFLAFVVGHPRWQRDRIARIYADVGYLEYWAGSLTLGPPAAHNKPSQPVTRVSWYAAKAYCAAAGKRLPTELEWELAAAADETQQDVRSVPEAQERLLAWYGRPTHETPAVGSGPANVWGIHDLHGLVWEWVYDFNTTLVTGDPREGGGTDLTQFCGAGALAASDGADYASFMRYALRSSLSAGFTMRNLGFRCARTAVPISK
ncbi:MAG: sulfatase modifying factor 1 [Myxococcota bacterium]|jgi:sulfatase modifying factor 1